MTEDQQYLRRWLKPVDVVDVLVYVVVLNLAIEYVPAVISESFTASLLTAIVLKLVLEAIVALKNRIKRYFKAATTKRAKVLAGLGLWLLLIGSKFVVLELIAIMFKGYVSLGSFWSVTGLILALLLARAGVRLLIREPLGGVSASG